VRSFINELRHEGRAILICTHNLDEADRLCDRIAVFKTRLLALDSPSNLRRALFGRTVVFHLTEARPQFLESLRSLDFIHSAEIVEDKLLVTLDDPNTYNPRLVELLVSLGAQIRFIGEIRQTLEDVYLNLVNHTQEPRQ
jgi:ABC-2 type transport system ATP-binding protein